jgi:uncharacterized RDD family membrane protein YckC
MNTSSANAANPYAPPRAEVRDTAPDDGEMQLAGRGERLGAALLDSLVWALVVFAPLAMGLNYPALLAREYGAAFASISSGHFTLVALGVLALLGVTAYLVHKNSQTIGKKLVGIKVVRSDFSPASFARILFMRNLVNVLPGLIPYLGNFYSLIDHLFIFSDRRQCVHDKIADTVVVKA